MTATDPLTDQAEWLLWHTRSRNSPVACRPLSVPVLAKATALSLDELSVCVCGGRLYVTRGTSVRVEYVRGSRLLAHTHTGRSRDWELHVGVRKACRSKTDYDLDQCPAGQVQAVVYPDELVILFTRGRVLDRVPRGRSPVSPDGLIDGKLH